MKNWIILFLAVSFSYQGMAQDDADSTRRKKREDKVFNAIPLVFSSPETDLAFGGFGIMQKHLFADDTVSRKSVIPFGATYTLNNQAIIFSQPDIFFRDEKFRLRSIIGYGLVVDRFWGIGNSTPESNEEEVKFTQMQLEPTFYYSPRPNLFVGLQYRYYHQFSMETEANGLLEQRGDEIGGNGAISSGFGPALLFDSRKNQVNASNGWYVELSSTFHGDGLGSEYSFNRYLMDIRHYIKLHPDKFHVLAFQAYGIFNSGQPPFKQMGELGGTQLRGYFRGRFRDRQLLSFQTEYRSPLLFWRVSATAFAGVGRVADEISDLNLSGLKPACGGGFRIMLDKVDRLNLRLDFGFGEDGNSGFYLGFSETF